MKKYIAKKKEKEKKRIREIRRNDECEKVKEQRRV